MGGGADHRIGVSDCLGSRVKSRATWVIALQAQSPQLYSNSIVQQVQRLMLRRYSCHCDPPIQNG